MRSIEIQDSTFSRLQALAEPLVDTVETVIVRLLDQAESADNIPAALRRARSDESVRIIDPASLPNMIHSKVVGASVNGKRPPKINWNSVLNTMLREGMKKSNNFQALYRIAGINMVEGYKTDDGFSYLDGIDISVQGQDSNHACRAAVAIAEEIGVTLDLEVLWRNKPGAAYPGEHGQIRIGLDV